MNSGSDRLKEIFGQALLTKSAAERLQLFIKVCQAVQHAHQKAVIHRDLKPSNILVTLHDGEPVPKVIDFGVAKALGQKLTEKTLFTAFRQMIGTPAYMSPEQAELGGLDIDTRADIYSLGVLLYELLTGVTPFDREKLAKAALDEIRRMIRETEPPKPSTRLRTLGDKLPEVARHRHTEPLALSRLVRGDLDWIVMKCLEKNRTHRYETANGLAREISRFLNNEPVAAAAPSALYRAQKFVRRHKAALATASALAGLLAAGTVVSTWEALRATRSGTEAHRQAARAAILAQEELNQRQLAESMAEQSQLNLYSADIALAQQASDEGNFGRARALLEGHVPGPGQKDLRGFEWRYLWKLCRGDNRATFLGHSNIVTAVAFSPDGKVLASGSRDNAVKIWDLGSGKCLATFSAGSTVNSLAFSSDGLYLAAGTEAGASVWNSATGQNVFNSREQGTRLAFSPLGHSLAIGSGASLFGGGGSARIVELPGGKEVARFTNSGGRVAFSADGKSLVTGDWKGEIRLWEIATQKASASVEGAGEVAVLSLSPDGRILAAVSEWSGDVALWDLPVGRLKMKLVGHKGRVWGIAFSPDGSRLGTVSSDQTVRLWKLPSGQLGPG